MTIEKKKDFQSFDTNVTQQAVRFALSSGFADIPTDALEIAKRCMLDTVGLYVAGLSDEATRIIVAMAASDGGREDAFLLGAGQKQVPAQVAARAFGISAHAHDFDDTQVSHDPNHVYGLLTHPTTAPLSAALSVSQMLGHVDGERFLAAFNIGFEVSCKVSEWLKPEHYLRGHHSSGTVATFGAATAAAWLLELGETEMRHTLGLAASMAAGVRCSFGTMAKPWHVGRASENGVLAALMAKRGFTADPDALDGKWGFAAVLANGFSLEKLDQGMGRTWSILDPGVSIKPYPSGILTHQAMDMVRKLVIDNDVAPENVERIEFFAGDNILNPIRYAVAKNGLQAKFSMAALISMLVLRRSAGLPEFEDKVICAPAFQDMQKRITTAVDPQINAKGFDLIRSRVVFHLKDGGRLEAEADTRYRGGPLLPMSDADLEDKFRACCVSLESELQDRLIASVRAVGQLDGPRALATTLSEIPAIA